MSSPGSQDPTLARRLGLYGPNTVEALKRHLFLKGELPTPWSEIDTVLVLDLQYYLALLGDGDEADLERN